ncbi:MAG: hypothetical protein Q9212_007405, partial [Teloschistes hypoglaucus]
MLYTLFQRLHTSALTSLNSATAGAKSSDNKRRSYPLGSYEPSSSGGKMKKKYRHPL